MEILTRTPAEDGFYMPGEFEAHHGCLMIWPTRPGSWIYGAKAAQQVFAQIASEIGKTEQMYMLVGSKDYRQAREALPEYVQVVQIPSDDAWARDVGPTFVIDGKGGLRGINWSFNAWGGTVDGLYADWQQDDAVAKAFLSHVDCDCYDASPFVLEGGSIHSDGEGTMLVTEACLLSDGRNSKLSKMEIEEMLKRYCGAKKVIWLPRGIHLDETNEHVDNVCAFVKPGHVVLAWTDDEEDPQYPLSMADYEVLKRETDAKGRTFEITKLPIPKKPVCITEEELAGFTFEAGEEERTVGERLAASYVNFYIANGAVLLPQFHDEMDSVAVRTLQEVFPDRKIVPIYARDIIVGGGNIHCITQQIPAGGHLPFPVGNSRNEK
ncbi:MAG: agmatine deiminase [Lachnospiraceae bacterium]|nr:agmatine deiminase [Lachnospiraceae bacterium]